MNTSRFLSGLILLSSFSSYCQTPKAKEGKWDVENPPGNFQSFQATQTEGSWMNLDISPDGKTIVFDLLGDIYQIPINGGKAQCIRGGHAWESQARFSPDGKKIVYTSDKGGGDNIWVMNADGSKARAITQEDFRLLNNPYFTPDGQYIVARKHFTSGRSLGAGEIWMYHLQGGGSGIGLTKRKNDQQDVNEPCVSKDGRYLYYSEDVYPGGYFQYNKDPNSQIYVIKRMDLKTGKTQTISGGPGGACRPQISPDGKTLAYIRRVHEKTVLYLQDLETGISKPLFDQLSKDQQEAWAIFGTYPGFCWTPDQTQILIWGLGKINKIDVKTGQSSQIPFEAAVQQKVYEAVRFRQQVSANTFRAKAIRHVRTSPDGKWIVFNAAGFLYKKQLPAGKPERLSSSTAFEFEPAFSPDGQYVYYVQWDDEKRGALMRMRFPKGSPERISQEKGLYRTPQVSPDGKRLLYVKEDGNNQQGHEYTQDPGIYWLDLQKPNEEHRLKEDGERPQWLNGGERVFYQTEGNEKQYRSIALDGTDDRLHFNSQYTNQVVVSPDSKWIAFTELYKAYVAAFPLQGKNLELSAGTKAFPVALVAKDAGYFLHWSADSKSICWSLGEEYFSNPLNKRFAFLDGAPDSLPAPDSVGLAMGLELKEDYPEGWLALVGADLITMEKDSVIKKGTILIHNQYIEYVGPEKDSSTFPVGTKIIHVEGKTIMPGLVDVHAHLGTFRLGLSPQKEWTYYANLAFGVTTTHDPSSTSEMVFSQAEAVRSGAMVGPRIYSTGTILYGADGDFKAVINSLEDAKSAIRRTKAWGAFSVKSYNQPRREQRQQVIEAARQLQMNVVPEGGSFFYHNMSMILDGHSGIEHNIPVTPVQSDVLGLWSFSKTGYTPTLIVSYGAVNGENYWYQKSNVWQNQKLLQFMPRGLVDSRSRHRTMIPDEEYEEGFLKVSRDCSKLTQAGVKVNLGAHGQLQGLGAHWELWMLQMGGLSNYQALRCATQNGADYIGMGDQLGSLRKGKLADLIVLDKNPLDNIRNSESVRFTMVNGKLYDAFTLNEIGLRSKKRGSFYWEQNGYSPNFPWHEETCSFQEQQCSCRH